MSGNIIQLNEQFIHSELKTIVKNSIEETINALLDAEADKLVQKVPKLKGLTFESAIIQRYQRRKCSVEEALVEMYFVEAGIIIKGEKSVCR